MTVTQSRPFLPRRRVLTLGAAAASMAQAHAGGATTAPPQPGDVFAFSASDRRGAIVQPADVATGAPPLLVWPMAPQPRLVRDGSRENQVLLLRLAAPDASIVAFSAICTHAGCAVSQWKAQARHFLCPCHLSEYDPQNGAAVVAGPAPRPLPALPVEVAGGVIRVASGFSARIGGSAARTD